jgi:uncharacterized protein (TIGR03086 family)
LAILAAANRGFAACLRQVDAGGNWAAPTPCTEWDVRALVNHVVGANVRYQLLLDGAALDEVEATRAVDHLGDDALAAFETSSRQLVSRWHEHGAFDRVFRHVIGERTGGELLDMRILDVGVHTWDLACAIGTDRRIDDAVVAVALTVTMPCDDESESSAPQDRLLLRTGRHPTREEWR